MLLARVLSRVIGQGQLTIIDPAGRPHRIGGTKPGPAVTMRVHDRRTECRLLLRPRLAFGESYMDGTLTVEDGGDLYALLDLLGRNMAALERTPFVKWSHRWQRHLSRATTCWITRKTSPRPARWRPSNGRFLLVFRAQFRLSPQLRWIDRVIADASPI